MEKAFGTLVRQLRLQKGVLLQKSKSAIFDGCNPLKYRDTILDKNVKNQFLQQSPCWFCTYSVPDSVPTFRRATDARRFRLEGCGLS
jgi:hypothetical protein